MQTKLFFVRSFFKFFKLNTMPAIKKIKTTKIILSGFCWNQKTGEKSQKRGGMTHTAGVLWWMASDFSKERGKAGKAVVQPSTLRKNGNGWRWSMAMIGLRASRSEEKQRPVRLTLSWECATGHPTRMKRWARHFRDGHTSWHSWWGSQQGQAKSCCLLTEKVLWGMSRLEAAWGKGIVRC